MPRNPLAAGGVFEPDPGNALAAPPSMADAWDVTGPALAQNMRDTYAAASNPQTWQDAADQYRSGMLMGSTAPEMKGLGLDAAAMKVLRDMTPGFRAYHASPYSFDRFDSSKIGTGEGAQMFGHGLYVADAERVMDEYYDAFNQQARQTHTRLGDQWAEPLKGQPLDQVAPEQFLMHAHQGFGNIGQTPAQRMRNAEFVLDAKYPNAPDAYREAVRKAAAAVKPEDFTTQNAVRYEVNVAADPAHMLDWDKPLSEQTPHVQEAFSKVVDPYSYKELMTGAYKGWTAGEAHDYFGRSNPGRLAEEMQAAGIPGIRYLDGGSRAGGEGTRNTVIFDPATIAILRKYGLAGLMAGGGAAASGQPQQ